MKKLEKIDKKLIIKFRDKVNSNSSFVIFKYRNVNGKNLWNIICSSMDWISVAITYLDNLKQSNKDIDIKSMQVYTYISAIDIIFEAVTQLHRVFIQEDTKPFQNQKNIFTENYEHKDDNTFFKHIRAIFGAHPVNIKNSHNKWFASWPTDMLGSSQYDLQVFLYSNNVSIEDKIFGVYFEELNQFLIERYYYLNKIMNKIDENFNNFVDDLRSQKIDYNNNPKELLYVLSNEVKKRLNNDYYRETINDLILLYNTYEENIVEKCIFEEYIEKLKIVVDEIYNNLQKMKIVDLETNWIINQQYPIKISYEISKLMMIIYENNNDPLFEYYIKRINEFSFDSIRLNRNDKYEVLLLKLKTINYMNLWKD